MKTTMMLCDFAEAIQGKLYIMGGGWTICPPGPRNMSIALRILVPWDGTNKKHHLKLMLQDVNGKTVEVGDPPRDIAQQGDFEVGRPPNVPAGSEIDFSAVFNFLGLPLMPDLSYRWQLEINGEPADYVSFRTRE
ncbi:MAG: hypothetical protein JXA49_11170 [Actinobacteria bacterium]|nr:hypothetical protein [Actinomycetota bacterium]